MFLKVFLALVIGQGGEHGAVLHMMSVDDAVGVREVALVLTVQEDCAAGVALAVEQAVQIVIVVPGLHD